MFVIWSSFESTETDIQPKLISIKSKSTIQKESQATFFASNSRKILKTENLAVFQGYCHLSQWFEIKPRLQFMRLATPKPAALSRWLPRTVLVWAAASSRTQRSNILTAALLFVPCSGTIVLRIEAMPGM
jgi:hypothetical protein